MMAMRGHRANILYLNLPTAKLYPLVMVALHCRQCVQGRAWYSVQSTVQFIQDRVHCTVHILYKNLTVLSIQCVHNST